jgi:hypothetical protein
MDHTGSGLGKMADTFECSNESTGSIKWREFLEEISQGTRFPVGRIDSYPHRRNQISSGVDRNSFNRCSFIDIFAYRVIIWCRRGKSQNGILSYSAAKTPKIAKKINALYGNKFRVYLPFLDFVFKQKYPISTGNQNMVFNRTLCTANQQNTLLKLMF